ncbi:MAG: discoidin domain-containing protein [Bacteroidota bacterium]
MTSYKYLKQMLRICLLILYSSLIFSKLSAQTKADRTFLWDRGNSPLGYWLKGINCGDPNAPGGENNTKGVKITFGSTKQQRFSNSPSVELFTNANIQETCGPNKTAERAELFAESAYRTMGAKEGATVWLGWSDKWTDIDESHTSTVLQFRSRCGGGNPAIELMMSPNRKLQIRSSSRRGNIDIVQIKEDVWYDFVAEIKYSKSNNGYLKVWAIEAGNNQNPNHVYSSTPTAAITNIYTMYSEDDCPHLRWGIYRHESADKSPSQINSADRYMVRYIGPIRMKVGNNLGKNGFDAVKPRNINGETEPAIDRSTPSACSNTSNLAFNKQTNQSTIYARGTSNKAVDSYKNTDKGAWVDNGVTHTQEERNPWWEVDLGAVYTISQIKYTGRTENCCKNRARNAHIMVSQQKFTSNDLNTNLSNSDIWKTFKADAPSPTHTINTGTIRGRYVRIQLESFESLSLADVQVIGGCASENQNSDPEPPEEPADPAPPTEPTDCSSPANLAFQKSARQSSQYGKGSADRAVDADESTNKGPWENGGVTHTQNQQDPWWEVDLGAVYDISRIQYSGRTDCCKDRMENTYVFVSKEPFSNNSLSSNRSNTNIWHRLNPNFPDPTIGFNTGNIQGRYVRIQIQGKQALSLADVQVFGCTSGGQDPPPAPEEPVDCASAPNIALQKTAQQSSTYGKGTADKAVDTDASTNKGPWASSGAITHTQRQQDPWWEVDLGAVYTLSKIQYTGRTDCCKERLENTYVFVSRTPFSTSSLSSNRSNSAIWHRLNSNFPNPTISFHTGDIQGRYVRIQIQGNQALSLADVKVFGCSAVNEGLGTTQTEEISSFQPATSDISAELSEAVKIFPNVANRTLYLEVSEPIRVQLTDLNGLTYKSTSLASGKQQIDLSDVPNGVYVVIEDSGTQKLYHKIIVQH